jgi:hypothetical protein
MNDNDRLKLNDIIKMNDVEDVTSDIREKKHSLFIKEDVIKMIELKNKYSRIQKNNPKQFDDIIVSQCNFLFTNYTDIFNKLKKDELDINILMKFIYILHQIEIGKIDQHDGAYQVGTLLKKLYVDSALKKADKNKHNQDKKDKPKKNKNITWNEYKNKYL